MFSLYLDRKTFVVSSENKSPLLAKLLREPNWGMKRALDSEKDLPFTTQPFFWESLLSTLRSSSPVKAQLVLEWKLDRLLKEENRDQSQYSQLISLCGKVQNAQFAITVFTMMEAHGIQANVALFNSLISACLLAANMTTALSLFEIMKRTDACKPDLATYNAFISVYSKIGDAKTMEAWYLAGKTDGFSPDILTYDLLIVGFVKAGMFNDAQRLYDEMISSGFTPCISILESILEGLCKQKKLSELKEYLMLLKDHGWDLNEGMVEKILRLYIDLGKLEEMEELLVITESNQNSGILAQVHCGIIRLQASCDRLDKLEYSVQRMLKGGMLFTCPGDVEAIISSYFRQAAYERLDLFLDRIHYLYNLTKSTYDLLIAGYRRAGLSEKLDLLMEDIKKYGFPSV